MLIMSGRPIKTCADFYDFYDPRDALNNMKDLVAFADGNLRFNKINDACIKRLEEILKNPDTEIICRSMYDFWQGTDVDLKIPAQVNNFLDEGVKLFSNSGPGWGKRFVSYCALSIIADKLSFEHYNEITASGRKTNDLDFSKEQIE